MKKLIAMFVALSAAAVFAAEPEAEVNLIQPMFKGYWHIIGKKLPSDADTPKGVVKFASAAVKGQKGYNRMLAGYEVVDLKPGKYLFSVRFRVSKKVSGIDTFALSEGVYSFVKKVSLSDYQPEQWKTVMNQIVVKENYPKIRFYFQSFDNIGPFTVELDSFKLIRQDED